MNLIVSSECANVYIDLLVLVYWCLNFGLVNSSESLRINITHTKKYIINIGNKEHTENNKNIESNDNIDEDNIVLR